MGLLEALCEGQERVPTDELILEREHMVREQEFGQYVLDIGSEINRMSSRENKTWHNRCGAIGTLVSRWT
jgi:hypothetical protein